MPARDPNHHWHGRAGVRERYVFPQLEQADDRSLLLSCFQFVERAGQVPARAEDRGTTGAVVPVRGRVKLGPGFRETGEELLDQQPVVDDDGPGSTGQDWLLVGEVGVVNGGKTSAVALSKNPAELPPSHLHPSWDDQGGVAEIDEADLPTPVDAPTMT